MTRPFFMFPAISGFINMIFWLFAFLIMAAGLPLKAQDPVAIDDYLKKAGYYSDIYSGKTELPYSPRQYDNFPYYNKSDFTEGEIIYKKNNYSKQQIRLDLYQEQLVVLVPEKQYRVIVNPEGVERVSLFGKTFVWQAFPPKGKLKTGYYLMLFESDDLKLFYKESFVPEKTEKYDSFSDRRRVYISFDCKKQYYIWYNNQYYPAKNKSSFTKLFPQYKKQIDGFVKENKLDFRDNQSNSLTLLIRYCKELMAN